MFTQWFSQSPKVIAFGDDPQRKFHCCSFFTVNLLTVWVLHLNSLNKLIQKQLLFNGPPRTSCVLTGQSLLQLGFLLLFKMWVRHRAGTSFTVFHYKYDVPVYPGFAQLYS